MNKSINARPWTKEDDEIAAVMRSQGKTKHDIAERLGRSADGVRNRLYWISKSEEERKTHSRTRKRTRAKPAAIPTVDEVPTSARIDRERRILAPRSLTAIVFGDPEIGRSALCQRMAGGVR